MQQRCGGFMDQNIETVQNDFNDQDNSQYNVVYRPPVKRPVLTFVLIALTILVWITLKLLSQTSGESYNLLLTKFGEKNNALIIKGEYWRFFTPMLLHSGIVHLVSNCYALYCLGTQTELLYGRKKFMAIYILSGFMGSIASFAFSTSPSVGASGAIYGLMGAMLYFIIQRPVLLLNSVGINFVAITVLSLVSGFTDSRIDYFAHFGGLIGGFLIAGAFYSGKERPSKIWISGARAVVLAVCIAAGGLLYGFNSPMNRVFPMLEDLQSYNDAQKWTEAEQVAEEILSLKPSGISVKAEALWGVTVAEIMQDKWEEGSEHASQLIEIDPESGHYLLGVLYIYNGDYENGRKELLLSKKAGNSYAKEIDRILKELGER